MTYFRSPFFLRGDQGVIDRWMASIGLPSDAPRYMVSKRMNWKDDYIDGLFALAGLSPRDKETTALKQMSDTMDSHRLGMYAASVSSEKSERLWTAFSRRYFMGKDTQIRPLRLDNHALLLECAEEAGLDRNEALRVLKTDAYRQEILDSVEQSRACGISSIPVITFEVDGKARGAWRTNQSCPRREVYRGSGSRDEFSALLRRLHAGCQNR